MNGEQQQPARYVCERCGGSGRTGVDPAPSKGVPNHADGRCGLCDGEGYLGVIGERINSPKSPDSSPPAADLAREAARAVVGHHRTASFTIEQDIADILRPFFERAVKAERIAAMKILDERTDQMLRETDRTDSLRQQLSRLRASVEGARELTDVQKAVLHHRAKGLSLEAVGQIIGLSKERVRQIEAKAKAWLAANPSAASSASAAPAAPRD